MSFEIQDGALILMSPPSLWHADTAFNLHAHLRPNYPHVTADVLITVGNNARRPDLMGLSRTREELQRADDLTLSANVVELAIEIILHDRSPVRDRISVARDREIKFREYAEAGIPEYWIVDEVADDPLDASVEMYRLKDGAYVPYRVVRLSELLAEDGVGKTA